MLQNFLQVYRFYQRACDMVHRACYNRSKHVDPSEGIVGVRGHQGPTTGKTLHECNDRQSMPSCMQACLHSTILVSRSILSCPCHAHVSQLL